MIERRRLRISGTVQGVGFRPFVHRLARELDVTGAIGNDAQGVWCEIQGPPEALEALRQRLGVEAPPLARVDRVVVESAPIVAGELEFGIADSVGAGTSSIASVPPDVAPCPGCRTELGDVDDRRYRYAFTCCTDCGPRYTVITGLPYDRERTSMAAFPLCADCAREYAEPADRRHHAQATCCPACGPTLALTGPGGEQLAGDPVERAASLIRSGAIVALKGAGGYQLLCRADDEAVVGALRARKHREEKPFALLVSSVDIAGTLIDLDPVAARALAGPEAPIVLAPRRPDAPIARSVAPDTRQLGVMLPATPLHVLLAAAVDDLPLVCTSGNRSDEPIVTDDARVGPDLGHIADAVLGHDRRIERRADDSVGQVVAGDFQLLRRARGFAPRAVALAEDGPTVLAVGAELKSTVCLGVGPQAHLSVHLGDLEHPAALGAFETTVADLVHMNRAEPELVVHDLHPEYLSTKFAQAAELAPTLAVQHHHAHLVACMADNARSQPTIGVAFDGLGWGSDGTLWGGEFLVGDAEGFDRAGHLTPVPLPGGTVAIRQPWRMALSYLAHAYGHDVPDLAMVDEHRDAVPTVLAQCDEGRSVVTSALGRLFDAIAALCRLADTVSYEGQAAIRLEQIAGDTAARYDVELVGNQTLVVGVRPLVAAVVADLQAGVDISTVAGGFHRWVVDSTVTVVGAIAERSGLDAVALSGGVFQNRLLNRLLAPALTDAGFQVLRHRQVPPNDGGIALGQVVIGRAMLAARRYGEGVRRTPEEASS